MISGIRCNLINHLDDQSMIGAGDMHYQKVLVLSVKPFNIENSSLLPSVILAIIQLSFKLITRNVKLLVLCNDYLCATNEKMPNAYSRLTLYERR